MRPNQFVQSRQAMGFHKAKVQFFDHCFESFLDRLLSMESNRIGKIWSKKKHLRRG